MSTPAVSRTRLSRAKLLFRGLRGRPDSEHEMSFNRLTFASIALTFVITAGLDPTAIPFLILFCMLSLAVFVQILFDSSARVWRRLLMMVADIATICYFMHSNGAYTAGFWPLLLWTILGNGFRFGNAYLFASAGISIVCFALVIWTTPFWMENMALSVGMMAGLILIPTYATKLIAKLSRAKRQAEEASRAKSYFLASVSHELRTPLTAIIGLGEHLRDSDLLPEQRNMAATVVTAGRSLLSLINQLLDFARLGVKGLDTEAKPFELLPMLFSVRDLMRVGAEEKGLKLAVHISARTPMCLTGDQSHIRDVLVNLVGNAVKFTNSGSITISADVDRLSDGALMLSLAVTDTGIGIEAEAQKHIFESFRQADDTIIDRFGGTGLGLAISKQVATLLGGEIGVESAPGQGSRFWFTAKVRDAADEAQGAAPAGGEYLLFSADPLTISAMRIAAEEAGLALRASDRLSELRTLMEEASPGSARVVLIDEQELHHQFLTIDHVHDALGAEAVPILLRSVDSEISDADAETGFVTSITPHSSLDDLTRAFQIARAACAQAAPPEIAERPGRSRRALRILIADDNAVNQKVFSMILERAGHDARLAGDGEAALDIMRDHELDAVLMDVNMPVLNGIEATKLYRFTALGRRRIPIIGITADASAETVERCLEAGMDACMSKPVEAEPLLNLLEELVESATPVVPTFDPTGVVTPLFPVRADESPAISWEKLRDLKDLGGEEFLQDLLREYLSDSDTLLAALKESIAASDVTTFRSGTHALRSSGANIGANKVSEMCLHLQRIERAEFEAKGASHLAALEAELQRVRQALAERDWTQPVIEPESRIGERDISRGRP